MSEIPAYAEWIGRTELRTDRVTPVPVALLAATLDREDSPCRDGDELPPLWHWLYFLPVHAQAKLGADGHPRRGGFLPPIPQPRRMWAGSRIVFANTLHIGETISRNSRIVDVVVKQGRSGTLVFVKLRHEVSNHLGLALVEEQDIVYRDLPATSAAAAVPPAPAPVPAPATSAWRREIVPDDVLLFRYSALTFNGHRIHYDRRYVTEVEGYPGLIVHGPLLATLLLDLLSRNLPQAAIAAFEFKALKPVFDIAPLSVHGEPRVDGNTVRLWVRDAAGSLCMDATASLA